ncbi:hypothetical protein M404DRAFT_162391, partial [Pisolithus tinctorius Marx 270]
ILAKFTPRDHFNFNETGFFPYAPPDRGLATKQMSDKKKEKFHLTIGLACNSDGSENLEPFFIGKFGKPCCVKNLTPKQWGFYYWFNKKAWMMAALFKE